MTGLEVLRASVPTGACGSRLAPIRPQAPGAARAWHAAPRNPAAARPRPSAELLVDVLVESLGPPAIDAVLAAVQRRLGEVRRAAARAAAAALTKRGSRRRRAVAPAHLECLPPGAQADEAARRGGVQWHRLREAALLVLGNLMEAADGVRGGRAGSAAPRHGAAVMAPATVSRRCKRCLWQRRARHRALPALGPHRWRENTRRRAARRARRSGRCCSGTCVPRASRRRRGRTVRGASGWQRPGFLRTRQRAEHAAQLARLASPAGCLTPGAAPCAHRHGRRRGAACRPRAVARGTAAGAGERRAARRAAAGGRGGARRCAIAARGLHCI